MCPFYRVSEGGNSNKERFNQYLLSCDGGRVRDGKTG